MNILVDLVPETVEIDGTDYLINSDFRTSILFELLMQDTEIADENKTMPILQLYYPEIPPNTEAAVLMAMWFYACGNEPRKAKTGKGSSDIQEMRYSFEHDAIYIYTAYLEQYHIDLQDIEDLHWWKFRAMFRGLREDCKFAKIMQYRTITLNDNMSKEERKFYINMKILYALPDNRSEEEKEEGFSDALGLM